MNKFWSWARDSTLFLDGVIAEESWFDDNITPKMFLEDLMQQDSDITVWINSPGGDCFAASRIYTMLMDYPGKVDVKIDGIAASAASVIAMAGNKVYMSPTSLMMIHNPYTLALGDSDEMRKTIHMLDEIKESIINAYERRANVSRDKISKMMDTETWMSAKTAVSLGFADEVLFNETSGEISELNFSRKLVENSILGKMRNRKVDVFDKRLQLLKLQ